MTGMWSRWARRKRLIGLGYLTLAAAGISAAVLLHTIGAGYLAGVSAGFATGFIVWAVIEFGIAHRYARLGVTR